MQSTMRAAVRDDYGDAEVIRVAQIPVPAIADDEVLIRVAATSVNYADSIMVAGHYQTKPERPFSPGLETAGVVAPTTRTSPR